MKQHFQHVSQKTDLQKKKQNSRDTFIIFQSVRQFKPNASRAESEEFFIIGLNYKRN